MRILKLTTLIEQELSKLKGFDYMGNIGEVPVYIMDHALLKGIENQVTPILMKELFDSTDTSAWGVISSMIPYIKSDFVSDYKQAWMIDNPEDSIKRNFVVYRNYKNPLDVNHIGKLFIAMIYGISPPFLHGEKILDTSVETVKKVVAVNSELKNYLTTPESLNKPYMFIQSFTAGFKPMYGQFKGFKDYDLRVMMDAEAFPYSKKKSWGDSKFVAQNPRVMVQPVTIPSIETFTELVNFQYLNNK